MNVDDNVLKILEKVRAGDFDDYATSIADSDFGIYLPAYDDEGTIKILPEGHSQVEENLRITISRNFGEVAADDLQTVAWIGNPQAKDSVCRHGPIRSCKHCTAHGRCRHCSRHPNNFGTDLDLVRPVNEVDAPELNYDVATARISDQAPLLNEIAKYGLGLALLHGHNDLFKFTKLPIDHVAVISDGQTHFRSVKDVARDKTFVPNIWRMIDGSLQPAGGFSRR